MDQTSGVVKVTEPLLVFGGPYSNLKATKAMLEEARRRAIPPGNIVCAGDLAAYCADPQAVIDLLRYSGIRIVMGNCEESLAPLKPRSAAAALPRTVPARFSPGSSIPMPTEISTRRAASGWAPCHAGSTLR